MTSWKSIKSIRNFVQLTPNIGTAGQPCAAEFQYIARANYELVVNLSMPDHADSIVNEGQLVTSLAMSYYHLPVPFNDPQPNHVLEFCSLMQAMQDRKVFVHCIMNYRVSAFMFHYLHKVQGYSARTARSPMFEQWEIEPRWQASMQFSAEDISLSDPST